MIVLFTFTNKKKGYAQHALLKRTKNYKIIWF